MIFKRIKFRALAGFAISAFLLWLTFHNSGLKFEKIRLHGLQWLYFSSAVLVVIFSVWVYSIRAKLIWANEKRRLGDMDTYSSLLVGNFYNCLLPGNLGDGIRAWHFSRKQQVSFPCSIAAIVTEKWIDAQMFVLLVIVLYAAKPFMSHYIFFAIAGTAGVVIILSLVYMLMCRSRYVEKKIWLLVFSLKSFGRSLFKIYRHTSQQLSSIRRQGLIPHYLMLNLAVLCLNLTQFFLLLKATGVTKPVGGLYSSYLIQVSMMIIVFIPSAPGNIGVLHYGIYSVLILSASQYGIKPGSSDLQSYALLGVYVHLSYFIPEVLLGIIYVVRERKLLFG